MNISTEQSVIDADGHVIESDSELLEYLPEPYRGREDILGYPIFPSVYGFNPAAARIADGKGRNVVRTTPQGWTEFLNETNIDWSVLYPTAGLAHGLIKDKGWAYAAAQAYNNFVFDRYHKRDKRLKGIALIPLQSVPDAVQELRRAVKELGMVGAILPAVGLRQPFGDEKYFPVYEAAQELNVVLAVHGAPTEGLGLDAFERLIEVRTLSHGFAQMKQMTSMIFGGVFDTFPRLKVAYAEAGSGWIPYLMARMDMEYEHRSAQVPHVKSYPSEHLKSGRIFIHCELEEQDLPLVAQRVRDDILFFASDFPHEPRWEIKENIQKFLAREDLPLDAKNNILRETSKRMYGLAS